MTTSATLLSSGTILVHESLILPKSLSIETSKFSKDWRVITTDRKALDTRISSAGWNFFFTVGKLESSAFGAMTPASIRRGLRSILRQVQDLHFNAVEIGEIQSHHTFGLIRWISVSAYARHIQRSEQLENDQERKTAQSQSAWAMG